jgi:hypothetical protein
VGSDRFHITTGRLNGLLKLLFGYSEFMRPISNLIDLMHVDT